jgi:hypothetical protein
MAFAFCATVVPHLKYTEKGIFKKISSIDQNYWPFNEISKN